MQNDYRFNSADHLHELRVDGQWVPLCGTSNVLSVLNKPGLVYWASGLAVKEFGCPDPKILTKIKNRKASQAEIAALESAAETKLWEIGRMDKAEYIKLLDRAYRAHATNLKDTAETGQDLHAHLESFVRSRMGLEPEPVIHQRIIPFVQWTDANVERFLWSETHCFSRKWHLGGISDCGFIDKQGRMGILDFKSAKEAYLSAHIQAAGYAIQIEETGCGYDADGNQTFAYVEDRLKFDYYAILPFGMETPTVSIRTDTQNLKELFLHALALYKAQPKD